MKQNRKKQDIGDKSPKYFPTLNKGTHIYIWLLYVFFCLLRVEFQFYLGWDECIQYNSVESPLLLKIFYCWACIVTIPHVFRTRFGGFFLPNNAIIGCHNKGHMIWKVQNLCHSVRERATSKVNKLALNAVLKAMCHIVSTTHPHNYNCTQFLFLLSVYTFYFISLPSVPHIHGGFHSEISYNYALLFWLVISVYLRLYTGFYLDFRRTKCLFFYCLTDICLPIFSYHRHHHLYFWLYVALVVYSILFLISNLHIL